MRPPRHRSLRSTDPADARPHATDVACRPSASAQLEQRALALLDALPSHLRMLATRSRFPHVLNGIAMRWNDPLTFITGMDELLNSERRSRQGFPLPVVEELLALRDYYLETVHPHLAALRTMERPGKA